MSAGPPRFRRDPARTVMVRSRILLGFWLLCGAGLLGRAVELQLVQGGEWRAEAERQHRTTGEIPAARGTVLDRSGVPLAVSHEVFRVSIAPHEVRDTTGTVEEVAMALGLSEAAVRGTFAGSRRWVPLPGRFPPSAREALARKRGVYVERDLRRVNPHGDLLRGVLGAVIDEKGTGGVEQQFEEHLRGTAGSEILARDSEGRPIPGESWVVQPPRSGGQVVLTLDADLQEIASEALREAMDSTGARGGDLVVTDPRTGEVLALVSIVDGDEGGLSAINAPYEPGSTLKPFTVATLLATGKASLADSVDTEGGQWRYAGRTITDVHNAGKVDLAHALRVSSNVGIAKVAQRLTPSEQYEGLRDFGFGVPTGVSLPGEVGGLLRRPERWQGMSPASLAIGYEISVTPLQMALAYGALANGGTLMEPRIIREVRDPIGRVIESFPPRAVRRVISPEVALEVNQALVDAVQDGTGTRARLATFSVAGKSGTSRAYSAGGGYEAGAYFASFVGFFPAEAPQLVVFVKLDRPKGQYYGGATAAPVTRATMEAILAAHSPPLDREALAVIARSYAAPRPRAHEGAGVVPIGSGIEGAPVPAFASVARGGGGAAGTAAPLPEGGMILPDLRGQAPRTAIRRLHGLGLVVLWEAPGVVERIVPAPGSVVMAGDTIRLLGPVRPGAAAVGSRMND
jgi:cell division protein FtsI (penicillin-binding protein 3)